MIATSDKTIKRPIDYDKVLKSSTEYADLKAQKIALAEAAQKHADRLKAIAQSSLSADAKRLNSFAELMVQRAQKLSDSAEFKANPSAFNREFQHKAEIILDSVAKSTASKKRVAGQVAAARKARITPSFGSHEVDVFGNETTKVSSSLADAKMLQFGDLSSSRRLVDQEYVDAIKETNPDQLSYKKLSPSYQGGVFQAQRQSAQDVNRDLSRLTNLYETGSDLNSVRRDFLSPRMEKPKRKYSFPDDVKGVVARRLRRMSKKSEIDDSAGYQKFVKKRDAILRSLSAEMNSAGIASHIMSQIESILSQPGAVGSNGMIDQATFSRILEMLNEQKKKDCEGISKDVLREINALNKKASSIAKKDAENEDSVGNMRMLQLILILAPIIGIPLLAPILSGVGSAVFGSGLAAGAPALMTTEAIGPLGSVVEFLHIDEAVGWLLTDLPILGELVGVVDTVLLSEPGQIIGGAFNAGVLSSPLIPIAGAVGFSLYMAGNEKYHKKKEGIDKDFKGLQRSLDSLKIRNRGNFDLSNAGADLADEAKRKNFVSEKYELLANSSRFKSMAEFVDSVMQFSGDTDSAKFENIFSPKLAGYLLESGAVAYGRASDPNKLVDAIAKIFYSDQENDPELNSFKDELMQKFGAFFKSYKSNSADAKAAINYLGSIIDNKSKLSSEGKRGNEIFAALYDLTNASQRVDYKVDSDFVQRSDFSDADFSQLIEESKVARNFVIARESEYLDRTIKQYKGDESQNKSSLVGADDAKMFNKPRSGFVSAPCGDPLNVVGRNQAVEV